MVSQQIVDIIIKAQDQASATARKVDDSFKRLKNSTSALSRIPGFDTLKSKVSGVASTLKTKLGTAVDGVRNKLSSLSNGAKGLSSAMNFLKGAVSMTVGMIGYDLLNSLVQNTRASLNARSGIQAFASRLKMSASEVDAFQASLDKMQETYKKIDMDVVGQQATDMAYRLGLPKQSLTELTETTAIFNDAMQRNGRSAEDAMLAMSDAMDGQFVRLKEIGISQQDLMNNGWSGDLDDKTGLLHAMNQALKEQHYDDLAKSVDTLDDAWQVLSITLSNFLEAIILPLTPAIVSIVNMFTNAINAIKPFIGVLQSAAGALPDWLTDTAWAMAFTVAILVIGSVIWTSLVPALAAATLAAIDFAMAMLANPLTWIVAALVAVALAVYEVGKAFGWWSDVQGMIDAVWAGITRLWEAFINHPDVQAFIAGLTEAWNALSSALGEVWNALMEFFGISLDGNFDIVRALIEGIGNAWNMVREPVMALVNLFTTIIGTLWSVVTGNMTATQAIQNIWNGLVANMPTILNALYQLHQAIFRAIFNAVTSLVRSMVNRVVSFLQSLVGKARSALMGVVASIRSAIQAWINAAIDKVTSLVSKVVDKLGELPGKITSALSGVVDAIVGPFKNAYDQVKSTVDDIVSKAGEALSAISGIDARGGDIVPDARGGDISYDSNGNVVTENINLTLDFKNVPGHLDTETLVAALTDKDVLKAFVGNRDFQAMDLRVKQQLAGKAKRYNGV